MSVGRLGARLVIGALFIGHGTQKIFGWFGGPGRAGTEAMMERIDMRPAKVHALLAGTTETVGGTLLAAGLATPLASAGADRCDDHRHPQGSSTQRSLGSQRRLGVQRGPDRRGHGSGGDRPGPAVA